ncbi:MAG: hypothetical protein JWN52_5437, partial [Actinomycetia bacterium]|nr:hypothetical protein [Actinomycetes bacterium]
TVVQGVWGVLLGRHGGVRDVVFGVTVAGRPAGLSGVERMVGLFINTLPVRVGWVPGSVVVGWLRGLQGVLVGLREFEHVGLTEVQGWSEVPRGVGLFDSLVVFENYPVGVQATNPDSGQGLVVGGVRAVEETSAVLTLVAVPGPQLGLRLLYPVDRYDAAIAGGLLDQVRVLLEAVAADPEQRVDDLPLLSEQGVAQQLRAWNPDHEPASVSGLALIDRFVAQVQARPDAVAVVWDEQQVTYGALYQRAARLSQRLRDSGVGPETLVGVLLERGVGQVVAVLAVQLAGGAYLPLDPAYPAERLRFLITDSRTTILITTPGTGTDLDLDVLGIHVVDISIDREDTTDLVVRDANVIDGAQLAYVIYTSGSTGRPKGVAIGHHQAARLFDATASWLQPTPADVWTMFHSLAFDFSVWELWGALAHGARLILLNNTTRQSPTDLTTLLTTQAITILNQTPSAFLPLADHILHTLNTTTATDTPAGHHLLPDLRTIIFGGETLPTHRLHPWTQHFGHHHPQLINMYGITETTVHVTHHPLTPHDTHPTHTTSTIGKPLPDLHLTLLNPQLHPVPPHTNGHIHINGPGLARGYLHQPALTAQHFIPDPHTTTPGTRTYRTGDLAHNHPNGTLTYTRRNDHQIQHHGHRIEPTEIQTTLHTHPHITDAVVLLREDTPGTTRLVAYLTTDTDLTTAELRDHCGRTLPDHMIPALFVTLDQLPLTPNGKLDREALPAPDADQLRRDTAYTPPQTPEEQVLADVWAQVLGVPRVGRDDNFFALGGDSILGMQIAARATRADLRITPRQIFQHQTVAELAAVAEVAEQAVTLPLQATGPAPLTPIQHWFFAQRRPAPHHFNQAVLLRLDEPVKEGWLWSALTHLIGQHPGLRSRFEQTDTGWRQEIGAATEDAAEVLHVVDGPADVAEVAASAQTSLDLTEGRLLRAVYIRQGEDGDRLLIVVHHLAVDAVSWRILLDDLTTAYDHLARGLAPPETGGGTPLRVWAERLQDFAGSADLLAEIPYWTDALTAGTGPLPTDGGDRAEITVAGTATLSSELSAADTRLLLRAASQPGRMQAFEVLLAALGQTLGEWTGRRTNVVHTEGHGREQLWEDLDLSRTVGWFTSIYPLALTAGSLPEALRAAKTGLRGVPNGGLGYLLLRHMCPDRAATTRLCALPEPDVLFNYLGQFEGAPKNDSGWRMADEATGEAQDERTPRQYALELTAAIADGRLHVRWTYSPSLHHRETVESLAEQFMSQVSALAGHATDSGAELWIPGDFPLAVVDQHTLDSLAGYGLDDLYPLSPMQQGMLFHLLYEPTGGVNVEQVTCRLVGPLETEALGSAWDAVVARHPVLRTSFHWRAQDKPLQAVHPEVTVPWRVLDWRGRMDEEQQQGLDDFLTQDRADRFLPEQAPLMRLTLIRLGDGVHELIWTHHHLLLDGWSLARVIQEVFAFYRAADRGQILVPPSPRPYRQYIAWLDGQDQSNAEAFWREAFAGFGAPTPLPVEPGPPPRGDAYAVEIAEMPASTLTEFARRHQLTLGTLVHAAWALFLARHSGERDVVFGTVVAGRPADLPGAEAMIGQFINTQPVRVGVDDERTILDWLREVQDRLVEGRQYEYTPLVEIHGYSRVPRDQPLFESVVVFENYFVEQMPEAYAETGSGEFTVERMRGREQTNYPLTLVAAPGDSLRLQLLYDGERYAAQTVQRYAAHLRTLLNAMAATPHQRPSDLPMLTEAERHTLLVDWNGTEVPVPLDRTLPALFDEQVARTPSAIALSDGPNDLTYAQLNTEANRLAHHLRQLGVGPEVRVALCLERSVDLVAAILAVFKAGGAYVPIDMTLPAERLAFMLSDADVSVVVGTEASLNRLPSTAAWLVSLDGDRELITAMQGDDLPALADPDDLAYVIYTSGSTGVPKGAMVEQRGMVNHLLAKVGDLGLTADDEIAATASPCFDISVWQFFAALLVGGRTRIFADAVTHDPARLMAETQRWGITVLEVVPSMLRAMLSETDRPELAALRWLMLTGEALPADLCRAWMTDYPAMPLVNAYGPTECSDDVTHHVIRVAPEPAATGVPIGRPIANTRLYVLDEQLRPVPVGASGELYVGGVGVGRGYLGRPDRTATVFVPDPFTAEPGERLYRTGDLVRILDQGTLHFLGRIDHQVKLRGFRIELGEIETVVQRHPAVKDTVVILREDTRGDQRLVAYVVLQPDQERDKDWRPELRGHCADRLPSHLLPAAFVRLDALPLTSNGKLDRRALPQVEPADLPAEAADPARPGLEEVLATLWADVLGVETVGRHANFFAMGGHSLLAMRVTSRLPRTVKAELPVRALFDAPTVAAFARVVEQARVGDRIAAPLARVSRDQELPLSFAQQRLWFLDRWNPGSPAYNLPLAVRLTGGLQVEALAGSLRAVVMRHESLRTTFAHEEGRPYQVIAADPAVPLPIVDLTGIGSDHRLAKAQKHAERDARRAFDLERGPLLRCALLRLAPDDHVLLLNMHHIVGDGWSTGVFLRELTELYLAASEGRAADLPVLPVQYADFAVWQRDWLAGERLDEQLDFWSRQLAGAPTFLDLPTDRPRPAVQTHHGANLGFNLPPESGAAVRDLAQKEGVTVFMVLLAAFAAVLARYSGQEEVLVGTPIAGRSRPEAEDLIGFFANTLALRADLGGEPTFRELLNRVRDTTLDAYAHQDLPFERLVEALQPERSLSHSPLVQVLFVLQNAPAPGGKWSGMRIEALNDELVGDTARFDVTLSVRETSDGLDGNVEYNTDLFDRETIARLVAHYRVLLAAALAEPDRQVVRLPLLEQAEQDRLLLDWNRTTASDRPEVGLAELLTAQAQATPDAVAVTFEDRQLTYAHLWTRAVRLAHRLRNLGVGPEARVGVCLERSPDLVVAVVGVLLSGGAYVPLDPDYPIERLRFMLADSRTSVLVTEESVLARLGDGLTHDHILCLDALTEMPSETPLPTVSPENLAYVIYTSGSTGRPKGAMNAHRGVVNRLQWMQETYGITSGDRVLQKTPFSFDVSVWELLLPLLTGARLVLAEPGGQRDSTYLIDLIEQQAITTTHFVPSMLSAFLDDPEVPRCHGLRRVISSGEALPRELQDDFLKQLPGTELHNLYGPTEAAVDVTFWPCRSDDGRTGSVPIGRPVANTQVYLLDPLLQPVPIGVPGELYLGGVQVGRGYLDRPALTAERYPADPFGPPGARLYRTGDLVRWQRDGCLEFLGRTDHQVKIRGFRIEPGEVDAVLAAHPAVRSVITVVRGDDARLISYLVTATGTEPADLRAHCASRLPAYMVPTAFVLLRELPLNPSGKVDRRALPDPDPAQVSADEPPTSPAEVRLAALWQEILGLDRVGVRDDFFALGGHSLLAIRVQARLRGEFGVEVPLRRLFELPTIAGLAAELESGAGSVPAPAPPAIQPLGREAYRRHRPDLA